MKWTNKHTFGLLGLLSQPKIFDSRPEISKVVLLADSVVVHDVGGVGHS